MLGVKPNAEIGEARKRVAALMGPAGVARLNAIPSSIQRGIAFLGELRANADDAEAKRQRKVKRAVDEELAAEDKICGTCKGTCNADARYCEHCGRAFEGDDAQPESSPKPKKAPAPDEFASMAARSSVSAERLTASARGLGLGPRRLASYHAQRDAAYRAQGLDPDRLAATRRALFGEAAK